MNQTEVAIMAMCLDRERRLREHVNEGCALRELAAQPGGRAVPRDGGTRPPFPALDIGLFRRRLRLGFSFAVSAAPCVCAD
jgi:hypothetical protein